MKVTRTKIITTSSEIMNSVLNEKYGLSPNEIEKKSLSSKRFRTLFSFHRIERTKNYMTDKIGIIRKNMDQNKKKCEKTSILVKKF